MPEGEAAAANGSGAEMVPEPDPKQFEQLVEVVYRLVRDQALLDLERSGLAGMRVRS
jgi:hypothetical protein